jgi:hypothetical protein
MLEIFFYEEEDSIIWIGVFEGFFGKILYGLLANCIEFLDFCEEFITAILTREEPSERGEWSIYATRGIDTRTNLESDDIRISFYFLISF